MKEQERPRVRRSNDRRRQTLTSIGVLLSLAAMASAQVSPDPGHSTVGPGAGLDGAVSPTGGVAVQVPLDLPAPRGALPVPLSVVYTGSGRAGAAGQGWDIPISYVRRSKSAWRRKPYMTLPSGGNQEPVGVDRVTVSVGGEAVLMQKVGDVWWPARGRSFMELRKLPDGWSLKTLGNLEYLFKERKAGSMDVGLWVLSEIRDTIGGDKVELSYAVPDDGGCSAGLSLSKLSYTFDRDGQVPLYEIDLQYGAFWRPSSEPGQGPCRRTVGGGEQYAAEFEATWDDGHRFGRGQLIQEIRVNARNNLIPWWSPKTIRAYTFTYDADPTTDRPRLRDVKSAGEQGVPGGSLPVAKYHYGTLAKVTGTSSQILFGRSKQIPRPELPQEYRNELSTTHVDAPEDPDDDDIEHQRSRTRHLIRDFTGDGLPDLVYKNGSQWTVQAGRLTESGPRFNGQVSTWTEPAELFEQDTRRDTDANVADPFNMITTETWVQYADWDADGRMDVIDVRAGEDLDHWKVWLNRKAWDGSITWLSEQVNIAPVRRHLLHPRPFVDDSERIAIERSRTWPKSLRRSCTEQLCVNGTCGAPTHCGNEQDLPLANFRPAIDTMFDWKIVDFNQDGYLDVAAGTVNVHVHNDGTWAGALDLQVPRCIDEVHGVNDEYVRQCRFKHEQWIDATMRTGLGDQVEGNEHIVEHNQLTVFLNRYGAFQGIPGSPFPEDGHIEMTADQGAEHWQSGSTGGPNEGRSFQVRGLADPRGEGRLQMVNDAGWLPKFLSDRPEACEQFGAAFLSRQTQGAVDFDGDGLADLVASGEVRTRGRRHELKSEDGIPMSLSRTEGSCRSLGFNTAGLMDLDADGHPDLLHVAGGELQMASIEPGEGDLLSAQRLVRIENGYGAQTYIRYRNAKHDDLTDHEVPFPEIVVSEIGTLVLDGSAPSQAPTYFAYGGAKLVYDSLAASWVFPGYRRQITLRGKTDSETPGMVRGMMTITDRHPPATAGISYGDHVIANQIARVARFEIRLFRMPELMLGWNGSPLHGEDRQHYGAVVLADGAANSPPIITPELLECGDIDTWTGEIVSPVQCRKAGLLNTQLASTWRGTAVPPALENVWARSELAAVDKYGRPSSLIGHGDLRRSDDDVCTTIAYAVPADGGAFPSVISTVMLTDCGLGGPDPTTGTPRPIAAMRFRYDGLPHGQVGRGQLTARDVDRYGPFGLMGSYEVESFTYNDLGRVESSTSHRTLGTVATRAAWFTYDRFGATVTEMSTQASDTPYPLSALAQTSTWPSWGSMEVDHGGVITRVEYDAHGRMTRESVDTGNMRTTRRRYTYDDSSTGRRLTLETFPGTTVWGSENSATERVRAHTHFDALGRPRFTQAELGQDYGNLTLVSGLTRYDELGRAAFIADTFETAELPFVPTSSAPARYGTTTVYDPQGRPIRTVAALGVHELDTVTSVAADVYVRSVDYAYEAGQAVVQVRGAEENDPTSANFGFRDESRSTAIGRQLRRARLAGTGTTQDLIEENWDRLGRVVETRRYGKPANHTMEVTWTSQFDSLGRRLALFEPNVSGKTFLYDEEGNQIYSQWFDGPVLKSIENRYDGFGRMTDTVMRSNATVDSSEHLYWDVLVGGAHQPASNVAGRLSAVRTANVGDVYYSYDAYGRTATTSYRYDGHGDLIRESAEFTAGGRLNAIELDTPRVHDSIKYSRDSAGRVRRVTARDDTVFDAVEVSPKGQYLQVAYHNGVTETFDYAPDGREELLSTRVDTADGFYESKSLQYDAAGRVVIESQSTPQSAMSRAYEFDGLGRVTGMVQLGGTGAGVETYSYDPLGGIIARVGITAADERHYDYDTTDLDRLCHVGTTANPNAPCQFEYDGAGAITVDRQTPGTSTERYFTYNPAGQLVNARKGANVATFQFGPAGRAMTRIETAEHPRTIWHFGGLIEEVWYGQRPGDIRTQRRIPGPLGIVASLRTDVDGNDDIVYSHGDARGNRFFTDENGHVPQEATYGLFGNVTSDSGSPSSLTYTDDLWNGGDHIPEVGLTILGARAYDPELGRFLQRDPLMLTARAVTANPYAFAFNDPVNLSDPSGMCAICPAESPSNQLPSYAFPDGCLICTDGDGSTPIDAAPTPKGIPASGPTFYDVLAHARSKRSSCGDDVMCGLAGAIEASTPTLGSDAVGVWRNSPWGPDFHIAYAKGFARMVVGTGEALGDALWECKGMALICSAQATVQATQAAVHLPGAAIELGKAVIDDPGAVASAVCPQGNCGRAAGAVAANVVIGAATDGQNLRAAANAADDVIRYVQAWRVRPRHLGAAESPYSIAMRGGRHSGFLKNARKTMNRTQMETSIRSLQKKIELHEAYLEDPTIKVPDYYQRSPQYQAGLIKAWEKELNSFSSQQSILGAVLLE